MLAFPNLTHLDVSDNSLQLHQLSHLINLRDLDLQYNDIQQLPLQPGFFQKLQVLKLSYNKIPPSHLVELANIPNLEVLDLASNDLCTLPTSLVFLQNLQVLDLSSNNFNSDSVLVNPNQLFESLSSIPRLRKLNLSRNKLKAFHADQLQQEDEFPADKLFPSLEELDFSFNLVEDQQHLMFAAQSLTTLHILTITGNPFAITGNTSKYNVLERMMQQRGGLLVNETLNVQNKAAKQLEW